MTTTNEGHIAKMTVRGASDGKAAASWATDGNTSRETYERILKGLTDGDPEILDDLPMPDLSGQWADGLDVERLLTEELGEDELETYKHFEDDGDGESGPHLVMWFEADELITAYEDAFTSAVQEELERVCRYQLQP